MFTDTQELAGRFYLGSYACYCLPTCKHSKVPIPLGKTEYDFRVETRMCMLSEREIEQSVY